ncbi:MAG TPA: hypothetical protein VNA28_06260 [Solirubrobacteraceae bacterium]|nr:hypothetical protein [Solirubrobacteraceae bacterium]
MGLLDDAIKEHLELKRRRGADAIEISRLESEALGPVPRSADGVPELADAFEPPQEESPPASGAAPPVASAPDATPEIHSSLSPQPPAYEPPAAPPAYQPPAPPPPSAYEPPAPPPLTDAPSPSASTPHHEPPPVPRREPWMTADLDPEPEPEPPPEPEPEPESGGLFSRLRGGRRSKHDRERKPPAAAAAAEPEPYLPATPPTSSYDVAPLVAPGVQHEPDIVPADDEPDVEDLLEETPEFLEETPEHDRLWFEQRPPRDFNFDD